MNDPIFNEDDLKIFFSNDEPQKSATVDVPKSEPVQPETARLPLPPLPHRDALPKIHRTFNNQFEPQPTSVFQTVKKFVGMFVLIFIISFSIINGPALIQKMKYFFATEFQNQSWASNATLPAAKETESRIIIPKIRVNAPITWEVSENDVTRKLEDGVAHYKGTALPGQTGNVFITGHSSYYVWAKGGYKDVFALLDKLQAGDKIYIQYKGVNFAYEVSNQEVVSPDDLTVLNQGNSKNLSLMTCVPVGTNLRRLVVTAKQI